jgi:hypothetical protein
MTNTTSCDETLGLLDDYLDGELPPAQVHAVELHLAQCDPCREEERALRDILDAAADLPREMEPPRDLWPGISERLGARGSALGATSGGYGWLAMAAVLLVGMGVAAMAWMSNRPAGGPQQALQPRPPLATAIPVSQPPAWQVADTEYTRATTSLLAALDDPAHPVSPEARKTVMKNLATIDAALARIRTALGEDPDNPALARMLGATQQKKVDTLQRVLKLSRI